MPKHIKPPKWYKIYPAGTKEGNEEAKFFRALARNVKYEWRSTSALEKESGLPGLRVEEIIKKYYYDGSNPNGMIFQSSTNEQSWAYWERLPELVPKDTGSISVEDKKKRISKSMENVVYNWAASPDDEDYWIPVRTQDVGEIDDVEYFKKKMAKPLKFPKGYNFSSRLLSEALELEKKWAKNGLLYNVPAATAVLLESQRLLNEGSEKGNYWLDKKADFKIYKNEN